MSIFEMLDRLTAERKLLRYSPVGLGDVRRLYLSAAFARELFEGQSAIGFFEQQTSVLNMFERWIRGKRITVRISGRVPGALLARLEPPPEDIWEFRVTDPRPQLRVFVMFAAPDVLVVLLARNRDTLGSAGNAHGKKSKAWLEAMYGCQTEWRRIFGGASPFRGGKLADYITGNAEERA